MGVVRHGLGLLKDAQMYGRKRGRSTSRAEPKLVATATMFPWRLAAHRGMPWHKDVWCLISPRRLGMAGRCCDQLCTPAHTAYSKTQTYMSMHDASQHERPVGLMSSEASGRATASTLQSHRRRCEATAGSSMLTSSSPGVRRSKI